MNGRFSAIRCHVKQEEAILVDLREPTSWMHPAESSAIVSRETMIGALITEPGFCFT